MPSLNDLMVRYFSDQLSPSSSNILGGSVTANNSTIMQLPANCVWTGTLSVTGSAVSGATTASGAFINIVAGTSGSLSPSTTVSGSTQLIQLAMSAQNGAVIGSLCQPFVLTVGPTSTYLYLAVSGSAATTSVSGTANGVISPSVP